MVSIPQLVEWCHQRWQAQSPCLANVPFLCAVDVLHHVGASLQVHHTPTHTPPVVSRDDGHSPPSVCTIPASQFRDTMLLAEANTFSGQSDGRLQDAVYSPMSVHTTPASQSGPVEQKTVWLTPLSMANPHPPDGRLQDAVHSPMSVHTTPASQSGPAPSLTLSRRQSGWLHCLWQFISSKMMQWAHHRHTAKSWA